LGVVQTKEGISKLASEATFSLAEARFSGGDYFLSLSQLMLEHADEASADQDHTQDTSKKIAGGNEALNE